MQKKNKTLTLTLVLLLLVMVTLGTLGGTFAKYTSSATGTDSARVAKWTFNVNSTDITTTETFTIDLFKTAYTNVNATEKVVAPGTKGEFELVLTNGSEVTALYDIDYTVANEAGIPIKFSIDGTNWTDSLTDVTGKELAFNGGTETIKIQWKWVSADDATDTAFGVKGTDKITVTAKVTASQKVTQ